VCNTCSCNRERLNTRTVQCLYIFNAKNIVRFAEYGRNLITENRFDGVFKFTGVVSAVFHSVTHKSLYPFITNSVCGFFEQFAVTAFTAESKVICAFKSRRNRNTCLCKALSPRKRKHNGQFKHQIRTVFKGRFCTDKFVAHGNLTTLGKAAAHNCYDRLFKHIFCTFEQIFMTVVKRIEFTDDSCCHNYSSEAFISHTYCKKHLKTYIIWSIICMCDLSILKSLFLIYIIV